MFLSVIIPVYNAGKYISQCLGSLLDQNIPRDDYQIICVNDGSNDQSEAIIKSIRLNNPNIILVNKENGGVSSARNVGLDLAEGEWIWFVDSDDFVQDNIFWDLKQIANSTVEVDRIQFQSYIFNEQLNQEELQKKRERRIKSNSLHSALFCSLYRRTVVEKEDLRFCTDLDYGEDVVWICRFRELMGKSTTFPEVCYFYRQHPSSAMHNSSVNANQKRLKSFVKASMITFEMFDRENVKRSDTADDAMYFLRMALLMIAQQPSKIVRKKYLKSLKKSGLFPRKPLKEEKLKSAYVTSRTDIIGRLYNTLVMNCTTSIGFFLLDAWYRTYRMICRANAKI